MGDAADAVENAYHETTDFVESSVSEAGDALKSGWDTVREEAAQHIIDPLGINKDMLGLIQGDGPDVEASKKSPARKAPDTGGPGESAERPSLPKSDQQTGSSGGRSTGSGIGSPLSIPR